MHSTAQRTALLLASALMPCLLSAQTDKGKDPNEPQPRIITVPREQAAGTVGTNAAAAIRSVAGFATNTMVANDDGSSPQTNLGFALNFYGTSYSKLWVNNNGNFTFDGSQSAYRPFGLVNTSRKIIAAFFADVDTRGTGSGLVTYGTDTVDGHRAFGANYINVGYYGYHVDKKNSFQIILIERADTGAGNFDIEFNYNSLQWDQTDTSTSAAIGYSNGSGLAGTYYEFPGSLTAGAFLDSGPFAMISGNRNSAVLGRYVFQVRSGSVCNYSLNENARSFTSGGGSGQVTVTAEPSTCAWTATSLNPTYLHVTAPTGTVTGSGVVRYTVDANLTASARYGTLTIAEKSYSVAQGAAAFPSGGIQVTTNKTAASFQLSGPSYYSGSGTSYSVSAAPAGSYTITYGAVSGASTPVAETKTLSGGGTISFTATYGSTCTIPVIQTQPSSTTVPLGASAQLQVAATGYAPFTYFWYQGEPGVTTVPVGGNRPTLSTPAVTSLTKYWVRVSNTCGSINSAAATVSPTTVMVYADKAWAYRVPSDPLKVYKAPGDLIDIVVGVKNTSAQTTANIQVSFDATLLRPDFKRAYRRGSITELANKSTFHEDLTGSAFDNAVASGTRTVTLNGVTLYTASTANPTNEFIFRFQLKSPLPDGTLINPTVVAAGQTVQLLTRNRVEVRNRADIILTNTKLLYRTYAVNAGDTLDSTLAGKVNTFWDTLSSVAQERMAVIYSVDDYESFETRDRSSVSTVKWEDTRKSLPYDGNVNTGAEQASVNAVATTVDTLLRGFITRLGGDQLPGGRYVLIAGGDRVIPYYRTFEPMLDLAAYASGYYNASAVTIKDAQNNYFLTDMGYRITDSSTLASGAVKNVYVGRIDGLDATTMTDFLRSSHQTQSSSPNVVKLENYRRDGSLNSYQTIAGMVGYNVVARTPDPGGQTLDFAPTATQYANKTGDDPARWADLQKLFTQTSFDIFRSISHGALPGIYNSENKYTKYMEGTDILANKSSLRAALAVTHPFFILDSCLNGLIDFAGAPTPNANHLVHQLMGVGPRGIVASSGITYSNMISDYNNAISANLFFAASAGLAMNGATRNYAAQAATKTGQWNQIMTKTLLQTNLLGAPWARLTPPNARNSVAGAKAGVLLASTPDEPQTSSVISYASAASPAAGTTMQKQVYTTISGQSRIDADGTHQLVDIPGFTQIVVDQATPVVPQREIRINLPPDATNIAVNVAFRNPDTGTLSGTTNIPAFKPFYPVFPVPAGWSDAYVDLAAATADWDATYDSNVFANAQNTVVAIRLRPVKFTVSSKKADVYTTADATVTYTTSYNGIVTSFSTDSDRYFPGGSIATSTGLENTSPATQTYTLDLQVLDSTSNVISSSSLTTTYGSGQAATTTASLNAPLTAGTYTVTVSAKDSANTVIGTDSRVIQVDDAPSADLVAYLSSSSSGTAAGSTYTYNATVTNNGRYTATGVYLLDILPIGMTYVSATTSQGSCSGTTSIGCDLGTLAYGNSAYVTIVGTGTVAGPFANRVTVSGNERDPDPTNNTAGAEAAASGTANMALSGTRLRFGITESGTAVTQGQTVTINISGGTVNWTASGDKPWISVSPGSGTNTGKFTVTITPAGLSAGLYTGYVNVYGSGASSPAQSVRIELNVVPTGANTGAFGSFDTPTNATTVASSIPVTGWTLDDVGVSAVRIYRDPIAGEVAGANGLIYIGDAVFVEGARPDVEAAYLDKPYAQRGGWGYMMLTNFLPGVGGAARGNGTHKIYAIATDMEGNQSLLGSKIITLDNVNATKPFGAIDTPAQGGTASGASYVNFGWALTPQPSKIATNGSTVKVFIDGALAGTATYNQARADVDTLFPGYQNTGGAVGYKFLNTTTMTNGVHVIAWVVSDDHGNADGIGSRYFTVFNAGAGAKPTASALESPEPQAGRAAAPLVAQRRGEGDRLAAVLGYDSAAEAQPLPIDETTGQARLTVEEVERIELHLPSDLAGSAWRGYSVVRGGRACPPGGLATGCLQRGLLLAARTRLAGLLRPRLRVPGRRQPAAARDRGAQAAAHQPPQRVASARNTREEPGVGRHRPTPGFDFLFTFRRYRRPPLAAAGSAQGAIRTFACTGAVSPARWNSSTKSPWKPGPGCQ